MSYDIYTGLLKSFKLPSTKSELQALSATTKPVLFSEDSNHPRLAELKALYPIESIAGSGNDFSKATNLLSWVSGNIYHMANYNGQVPANAIDLLNHSFGKSSEYGINCVMLSIILTECLLSIGLKARTVFIMPCSPYDGDNHVVTHVYVRELSKWVMLDPTLNAYLTNSKGVALSLLELRHHLANQEPVFFNKDAKYNDDTWTDEAAKENIAYFAKNLFHFKMCETSTSGDSNISNRYISLAPSGYNPKDTMITNANYRIKIYGDSPQMQGMLEWAKNEEYHFCTTVEFE